MIKKTQANTADTEKELQIQLNSLQATLNDKCKEIQQLQKEKAEKDAQHAEVLQKTRMKYEEHLLSVTLQVNKGPSSNDNLAEMYRKKLLSQKVFATIVIKIMCLAIL
jgi:hypothetical protein